MINKGLTFNFPGHDISVELFHVNLAQDIAKTTKKIYIYAKELPGFDKLSPRDFHQILKMNLLFVLGTLITRLFIDNESYLMICGNTQLSRQLYDKYMGPELSSKIFYHHAKLNEFNLRDCELALLVPFVLTFQSEFFCCCCISKIIKLLLLF